MSLRSRLNRSWHQRLVALALGALLGLQLAGLWHGVQHARHEASAPAGGWGHDAGGLACELFDQLAHASVLCSTPPVAVALPPAPPRHAAPLHPGEALRAPAAFQARAPPRG